MASINGVQLKNYKQAMGTDGVAWSATVYIDGKKRGVVIEGGYGGEMNYNGDAGFYEELTKRANLYYEKFDPEFKGSEPDIFMCQILELMDTEKFWNKSAKKGYPVVIKMGFIKPDAPLEEKYNAKPETMAALRNWGDDAKDYVLKKYAPVTMTVYHGPADFEMRA